MFAFIKKLNKKKLMLIIQNLNDKLFSIQSMKFCINRSPHQMLLITIRCQIRSQTRPEARIAIKLDKIKLIRLHSDSHTTSKSCDSHPKIDDLPYTLSNIRSPFGYRPWATHSRRQQSLWRQFAHAAQWSLFWSRAHFDSHMEHESTRRQRWSPFAYRQPAWPLGCWMLVKWKSD